MQKKILYIITKSVLGGAGKYVYDLATHLPDEYSATVAAGGSGALFEFCAKKAIPTHHIKHFRRDIGFVSDISAFFELLALFWRERPDIIHVNSSKAGGISGFSAVVYSAFTKRPLKKIFTAHGWAFHEDRPHWQIFFIRWASRLTALCYDAIICVSEYDLSSAIAHRIAPACKLSAIHNGIDERDCAFLPRAHARQQLSAYAKTTYGESDMIVGTVGEFTKNKDHALLIGAFRDIAPQFPRTKLLLVGWGECKTRYESQIGNRGFADRVHIIENLPRAASFLRALDVFVLPSKKEGLPYVLLEAGLAGLPVAASFVGGIPEIISHGEDGMLVPAADQRALARTLAALLKNFREQRRLGDALRQKITREFALQRMLEATAICYHK